MTSEPALLAVALVVIAVGLVGTVVPHLPGMPLVLAGIALFTLAGAAGALSAPIAGSLADRGLTRPATGWALTAAVLAFGIAVEAARMHSLTLLVLAALILDAAVQVCQVLSLRSIYINCRDLEGELGDGGNRC